MIGEAIRRARTRRGLTQGQLADDVGLTRQHINNIEQNRGDIPISTAVRLARALGMSEIEIAENLSLTRAVGNEIDRRRVASLARRIRDSAEELMQSVEPVVEDPAASRGAVIAMPPGAVRNVDFFEPAPPKSSDLSGIVDAPGSPLRFPQPLITDDWVDVTIEGRVAAGLAGIDYAATDTVRVAPDQAPEKGWKALEAWGESMIEFGIQSGDVVYVEPRRGGVAATNELVIGWLNDGLVIKEWRRRGSKRFLVSGNKDIAPREIGPDDTWELQAIVRRVVTRSPRTIDFPNISGRRT